MRYIPLNQIKGGTILGKTLYGAMGEILLKEGSVIQDVYIKRLNLLGYSGLYVKDNLSEEIEIKEIITQDLKVKTIKSIKNFMTLSSNSNINLQKNLLEIEGFITDIVDELLSNKNLLIDMVDLKIFDDYTFYHSVNAAVICGVLGVSIGLTKKALYELTMSALLHDIGKVFIPKQIIKKPGKLTDEEFRIIQEHSEKGYRYLKDKFDIPVKTSLGILDHHEKYDGTGYPFGKSSEKISSFGKIIAIADVYDALTSDRVYRKGLLPSEAMEYIMGGGGSYFEPEIVKAFSTKVAPYPVGTCVRLSNGFVGLVAENYSECCLRPKIKVFKENSRKVTPYHFDLKDNHLNITIIGLDEVLVQ